MLLGTFANIGLIGTLHLRSPSCAVDRGVDRQKWLVLVTNLRCQPNKSMARGTARQRPVAARYAVQPVPSRRRTTLSGNNIRVVSSFIHVIYSQKSGSDLGFCGPPQSQLAPRCLVDMFAACARAAGLRGALTTPRTLVVRALNVMRHPHLWTTLWKGSEERG